MTASSLFAKYDVPVPRYTSYPTVPHWSVTPTRDVWLESLAASLRPTGGGLALYVHVPFCESLCSFCGCNTVITRDHGREGPYVDLVLAELDLYLRHLPALAEASVRQLHLGGGTPTFLSADHVAALIDGLSSRLRLRADDEFEGSIEADPRVTTPDQLSVLRERGFRRLSFGVQDIDPEVQRLVNRRQPEAMTARLCDAARALGYESVNLDLIYGLPSQTPDSMTRLADMVLRLRPDRLAVYSFARVPWIKPAQRKFRDDQVPEGAEKRALYEVIRTRLMDEGYAEIGLDHFALPSDALARAVETGDLYRNFMGYTERRTSMLLGLGVSAISETADCYHQNDKVVTVYERRVREGDLPSFRGHVLTPNDRRRRERILALMTSFRVLLDPAELDDARPILAPLEADGLIELSGTELRVLPAGRPFLRNVASCFDIHYRTTTPSGQVYSRAL